MRGRTSAGDLQSTRNGIPAAKLREKACWNSVSSAVSDGVSGGGDADARAADACTGSAGSCACARTRNACGRTAGSGSCARTACAGLGAARSGSCTCTGHACGGPTRSSARTGSTGAGAPVPGAGAGVVAVAWPRSTWCSTSSRRAALVTFVVTAAAGRQRQRDCRGSDACGHGETAEDQTVSHWSNLDFC